MEYTAEDKIYMRRALQLAKKGAGYVSPNPMVGAVLVKNGSVIGEGYHEEFGKAHAEVNAIRSAAVGKPTLAPEAAQVLIQATRAPANQPGADLTERELEVLALMIEGLNNRQIAENLVVSVSTAKFHVSSILSKLGVTSRTEAVAVALQNNLLPGSR